MKTPALRGALVRGAQVGLLTALFATVLVLLGRGPWTRWVVLVVLMTLAAAAVGYWRGRQSDLP